MTAGDASKGGTWILEDCADKVARRSAEIELHVGMGATVPLVRPGPSGPDTADGAPSVSTDAPTDHDQYRLLSDRRHSATANGDASNAYTLH